MGSEAHTRDQIGIYDVALDCNHNGVKIDTHKVVNMGAHNELGLGGSCRGGNGVSNEVCLGAQNGKEAKNIQ